MADAIEAHSRGTSIEAHKNAAFTAWLMGAGGQKTWGGFCEHLGLSEIAPQMTKEDKRAIINKAYAIADRLTNMNKGKR